ncbi:MAG TPA: DEAD/DEAH box helicase [bacterium]|nr:DEAD/DEAH box helicase [bacterium]
MLSNRGLFKKFKLNIADKISPIERVPIFRLEKTEMTFDGSNALNINIPFLSKPEVTNNLCLDKMESVECSALLLKQKSFEKSSVEFGCLIKLPPVEYIPVLLNMPGIAGKNYNQESTKARSIKDDSICIHGLKKSLCTECAEIEKEKKKTPSRIDIFEIIFPVLQPPLGENFDNPIVLPEGKKLYPFQPEGIKFLIEHQKALLGDEMGLGKSIQAIIAVKCLFHMGKILNALIVCPKSVLSDWEKKLQEWAPELKVIKIYGPKEQRYIEWGSDAHIYLTSYDSLRQDLLEDSSETGQNQLEELLKRKFNLIILDEVQKIKNPDTGISKAVKKINADWRWGLSGTPLENNSKDLISIFSYLKPGLLHYNDENNLPKIKESIRPYFLRRLKSTVLPELPEKRYGEVWLDLLPEQREAYIKAEQEGIIKLNEHGDSITVDHILALITELKQICNLEPVSKKSCKLEYLLESLDEICSQGDKAIIFSQYPKKTLKCLEPFLKEFNPLIYHGSLSDPQRDGIIKKFQEDDKYKVLLMSVKSGGVGLTLTKANYVFHFDLWWNPSVAAQAEDRTHRIGQEKTVFVTYLYTRDTIEERIQDILNRKRSLFKAVIDDLSDNKLSKALTEEELFSLFNLKKPVRR